MGVTTGETPTRPDERPLRRDAARNLERILAAAAEVFAERGLEVTLDDIAAHAGVGVGTVYRRFENKEQLIDALFDQRLEQIVELAERSLARDDPGTAIETFLTVVLEQQANDRGLRELSFAGQHGQDRVARARARIFPLVDRLVFEAQAAGQLRADLVPTDISILQKMLCSVMDLTGAVDRELWRRFLGIVLDGLRPSRDAPTPLAVPALDANGVESCMRAYRPRRP